MASCTQGAEFPCRPFYPRVGLLMVSRWIYLATISTLRGNAMPVPTLEPSPGALILIPLVCFLLSGCGGSHAEYDPKSPWVGARTAFGSAMAYVTNIPEGYSDKEVIRIGRVLTTLERAKDDKQYIRMMRDVVITPVPTETVFEIIAMFTVVADGYTRMFAPDFDVLVLEDSRGNKSTMLLSEFKDYAKERTSNSTGGLKNETTAY